MAEYDNKYRVKFNKGKQTVFLNMIENKYSISQIAKICKKSERTIRDWKKEKYLIDYLSFKILCLKLKISRPNNIKLVDRYWYVKNGAKIGGEIIKKKYGKPQVNEVLRRKKWLEWWQKEGKNKLGKRKNIKKPKKSAGLAEFVGIMIGDGGITEFQVQISISSLVDKNYTPYLKNLIIKLFGVNPSINHRKAYGVTTITISRKELVEYCQKIGLKKGNKIKQGLNIPKWIFKNTKYQKACLRGIMDTDGCIFNENHFYKNKTYKYKRWNITSASPALLRDLEQILLRINLNPKIRGGRCIQLEEKRDIEKYFQIVGTKNPKHLQRYLL